MNRKTKLILQVGIGMFVILLINWFVSKQSFQLDFTEEKRFTLTESTQSVLQTIQEPIDVFVFLQDENLPTDLKRLQIATKELLQSYKRMSNGKLNFVFENPVEGLTGKEREEIMLDLQRRGITPTNVRIKTTDGYSENIVYPGALMNFGEKQIPIMLLGGQRGRESIQQSIELLEYKFSNAITKLQLTNLPSVGFTQSNGELGAIETQDLRLSLAQNFYQSEGVQLAEIDSISSNLNLLVIAQPKEQFSEEEKFKIDQYIMNGGKTLWAIDIMKMNLDSLRTVWQGQNVAVDYDLNLDDQLFSYGVRLKRNLVRDLQSKPIPVVIDENGQTELFPWTFFPVISGKEEHIVTENLNPVSFEFASEVEALTAPNISSTVLLQTSTEAGVVANPVYISLEELRNPPPNSAFALQNIPLAVLLEGNFTSLYQYRSSPINGWQGEVKSQSVPTKMAVIADGDVLKNNVLPNGEVLPLGYDRSLQQQFGNKEFLLNLIDYLVLDQHVLEARNKQVELRLLNQTKVEEQKGRWQLLAFVIPILYALLCFGLFYFIRKSKYS